MFLLVRPAPFPMESAQGYLVRLSQLNGFDRPTWCIPLAHLQDGSAARLPLRALARLEESVGSNLRGPIFGNRSLNADDPGQLGIRYWNTRFRRYCPVCLAINPYHRAVWGLTFGVACHEHRTWLRDDCPVCGRVLRWDGGAIDKCACGAALDAADANPCTEAIVDFMSLLGQGLHGTSAVVEGPLRRLQALSLPDVLHLTWFLGAYAGDSKPKVEKIADVPVLARAIELVSGTIACVSDWPHGYHMFLERLHSRGRLSSNGNRLSAHFGRFYPALYRRFADPAFDFLRLEFERFVNARWSGQLSRRNRRLGESLLGSREWISIKEAARMLGTRTTSVRKLVEQGVLRGNLFATPRGRKMGSVLKSCVEAEMARRARLLTLRDLKEQSGLSKKRLYRLISEGRLDAVRGPRIDGSPVWQFDPTAVTVCRAAAENEIGRDSVLCPTAK